MQQRARAPLRDGTAGDAPQEVFWCGLGLHEAESFRLRLHTRAARSPNGGLHALGPRLRPLQQRSVLPHYGAHTIEVSHA
jgi:hypothetical protein